MDGGNLLTDAKQLYNKKIKNTAVGKAIRKNVRQGLNVGYDMGTDALDKNKYTKAVATLGKNSKEKM